MDLSFNATLSNSTAPDPLPIHDNTVTFIVGFGILILFVILGLLASAFLCITLKKDPYLWEAERERQLHDKVEPDPGSNSKERDKPGTDHESTQI